MYKDREREREQSILREDIYGQRGEGCTTGRKERGEREERKAMNKVESISSPVTNGGGKAVLTSDSWTIYIDNVDGRV